MKPPQKKEKPRSLLETPIMDSWFPQAGDDPVDQAVEWLEELQAIGILVQEML